MAEDSRQDAIDPGAGTWTAAQRAGRAAAGFNGPEALKGVAQSVRSALDGEAAAILLWETGSTARELACAAYDGPGKAGETLQPEAVEWLAGHVLPSAQPLWLENAPEGVAAGMSACLGTTINQFIAVPLCYHGDPFGLILVACGQPGRLEDRQIAVLSVLADFAALVTANHRLEERVREQGRLLEASQAQLIQSDKLNAMGRLVAFLAHEINNPIQSLRSGMELLLEYPLPEEKRRSVLLTAEREIDRLSGIVERVLGLSRRSGDIMAQVNLHQLMDETMRLLEQRLTRAGVQVERCYDPSLPLVDGLYDQLHQVFLNLLLNAAAAMPGGGRLALRTAWHTADRMVRVSVQDTGTGILPEVLPHIFEPFYTTRREGTGLGLAVCQDIIEKHNGRIDVTSTPGQGSCFTVVLPVPAQEIPS